MLFVSGMPPFGQGGNIAVGEFPDFAEMNRIYASYFPNGNYPARTTVVVSALPHPDFLLEIECEAVLE